MTKLSYSFMGMLLLTVACKDVEKVTPNGFKYTVIKAGDGATPKVNDIVLVDFQLKDSKDSVWRDSYKDDMPAPVEIRDSSAMATEDGITQMFRMLSVGDSVKVTMTVPKFFKDFVKRPAPPGIDTTLSITYTFKVNQIMSMDGFRTWSENKAKEHAEKIKAKDDKTIAKFLADNKIEAQRDTSGLYYVLHSNSGGAKPTSDNCVVVKYEGKLLENGNTFDKNPKIAFSLNQVIQGWKLAIPMLSKGDSATFYIPSQLAYGPQGNYGIPPNSILIFKVTLFDFKNTYDRATNSCK
jgi:FKBP-type peptidyl-prolyl cis-trans isomerase FkpA